MSMIKNQISALRKLAESQNISYHKSVINRAANTIEALSTKLAAADEQLKRLCKYKERLETKITDMNQSAEDCGDGWIYCGGGKNLPKEKINPITRDFCEYQVTFKSDDVTDIRHYKFGNGHWWNYGECMDKYVIAWRHNIEPYHEL